MPYFALRLYLGGVFFVFGVCFLSPEVIGCGSVADGCNQSVGGGEMVYPGITVWGVNNSYCFPHSCRDCICICCAGVLRYPGIVVYSKQTAGVFFVSLFYLLCVVICLIW